MPIKWNITGKAMKARGIMDQISAEYDGFIEGGSEHLADVKGLRSQVGDMHADLHAAANVMGNGSGNGDAATEKPLDSPAPPPLPQGREEPKPNPEPPPAAQSGIKAAPMEFHG